MKNMMVKGCMLAFALLLLGCIEGSNPRGCGGAPPAVDPPSTGDGQACTIQVTLNKADAGYSSDLYMDGNTPDLLIEKTTENVGAIVSRYYDGSKELRFFIKVHPTGFFARPYNIYSNSSWAKNTEASDTSRVIAFEDIPNWRSDRDYNDVVIAVEKVNCGGGVPEDPPPGDDGGTPPPSDPPPPPEDGGSGGIIIPAGGAQKVHANFLEATFKLGDLYLAGDPPELLIAKGSNKKGASARNFLYEGEELVFFMRVDGTDFYSNDPEVALVDQITDNNYRIYFDVNWDGGYNDVIVHIVLSPPEN